MSRILITTFLTAFILQGGVPSRTTQDKSANDSAKNSKSHQAASADMPSTISHDAANGNRSQKIADNGQQGAIAPTPSPLLIKANKDGWDIALICLTGALVIVGAFQIYFLWGTVSASRENAEAANQSARAVINSERAWILFETIDAKFMEPLENQQGRPTTVFLGFKNFGKSVGKMIAWKVGLYITDIGNDPDARAYDVGGTTFNPTIIPQGDPVPQIAQFDRDLKVIRQQELDDILINKTKELWLCGVIKYEDVLLPSVEHTTMICRCYRVYIPGHPPDFYLGGPDKYNTAT